MTERTVKDIRSALEQERRINVHKNRIEVAFHGGALVLAGEVESVAAKKLALEYAAAFAGGVQLLDRLTVRPTEPLEDGALADQVYNTLYRESAFNDLDLHSRVNGMEKDFRAAPRQRAGHIEIEVAGGVVTLTGAVESYTHKALAGVLVWWRRGTRNVINNLDVAHPMDDPDGEMTDCLRTVLEKDRILSETQINAHCRDFTAILEGVVKSEAEKELAEADAWCLIGVTDVENRLRVMLS